MSDWEKDILDPFLTDASEEGDLRALVEALEAEVGRATAPDGLRDAILAGASVEGRFARFVATVAELVDLDEAGAARLLDGLADEARWGPSPVPQVTLYDVEGGPRVEGAITGFVRMPAGAVFPEHEHLGDEAVLVVQGSFEDGVSGAVHRPGDLVRMAGGTRHDFRARPGPDLVYLVVVDRGVRIGELEIGPNDPRL